MHIQFYTRGEDAPHCAPQHSYWNTLDVIPPPRNVMSSLSCRDCKYANILFFWTGSAKNFYIEVAPDQIWPISTQSAFQIHQCVLNQGKLYMP